MYFRVSEKPLHVPHNACPSKKKENGSNNSSFKIVQPQTKQELVKPCQFSRI
jgi:hypothetical protein